MEIYRVNIFSFKMQFKKYYGLFELTDIFFRSKLALWSTVQWTETRCFFGIHPSIHSNKWIVDEPTKTNDKNKIEKVEKKIIEINM